MKAVKNYLMRSSWEKDFINVSAAAFLGKGLHQCIGCGLLGKRGLWLWPLPAEKVPDPCAS